MTRILGIGVILAAPVAAASLVDASGWLGDLFIGELLTQTAIIATGVVAEAIIPGSGVIVIKAFEAWLNAS